MTVKQDGPLPTPRPSNKSTSQSENKNTDAKVETNEKQPVASSVNSTLVKDDAETKENAES